MADSKISALPASTTPLVGTEVLPIVQSSAPKQVSVANLTAGRAVATGALTVTGDATLSTGNLIPSTAAKGINFTANTPAAGMSSQLLNWYEQGTWTPADGSGAGLTFSTATGTYTRIGRSVTLQFVVAYPITISVVSAKISGMPFTALNQSAGSCINNKINAAPLTGTGTTSISLFDLNGLNNLSNSAFSNGTIIGTITYFV